MELDLSLRDSMTVERLADAAELANYIAIANSDQFTPQVCERAAEIVLQRAGLFFD